MALLDALDRHARRRAEGIATLSVLVGPFERAVELWAGWSRRRGLRVLLAQGEDERAVVSSWAAALVGGRDLLADAEALVARALPPGRSHEPLLRNKTAHERRVLLERLLPPGVSQAAWALCRGLLEAPVPPVPGHPPDAVREAIARDPVEALQSLLELVPGGGAPALRVRMGPSLLPGLRATASLCSAAPSLTVACALTPEAFETCLRQGGSLVRAMLREGRLDVVAEAPSVERRKLARELKRARSRHEAFLYEQLCYHASTAGLFTLNEVVDLGDGNGPREVDLLCRELRLAVEIDGHFHFRAPDAYRRDQRKNVALQCAGYLVVRYLADDVEARPEEILYELDTLIAARRRGVVGQKEPHGHR
jgi:very-short-patch-repair endonuclease